MTPASPRALEYTPIFDWHPPRSRRGVLISCIAGSALVHALCFYLFQIIYPPTVALLPPPARVNIITPQSEDGRLLLRWLEAEDPALSSTTQRPPDAATHALPKVEHVPSYLTTRPALRELPPLQPNLSIPSARPPAPVAAQRSSPPAPAPPSSSNVTFSEELHSLGIPQLPPLKFTTSRKEPAEAAEFRIGVNARGAVQHCFLQRSSGDPALDEQARAYLLQCRFPQSENRKSKIENDLVWGLASFEWGNDLATPEGRATLP
ncbi:MAG TPA: hypothetical protein VG095_05290 [Chthoniobacterales bacterium]|nr:hypothetical protein [Chthoniobacterales bacterium]